MNRNKFAEQCAGCAFWRPLSSARSENYMLKPEIALGWRFGMPTETPADLQKIREKYMPEIENLMAEGGEE